ncbi:uncharacterized protein LOC134219144 [Armigeres subalbatus]|uniref:uncharacterized protein LOC134219144 n=1 Tax=Armigeres subalbatus TaxID=124917 RepID=UPI002ED11520
MKMIKGTTTTMMTTRLAFLVTLFALTTAVVIVKSDIVQEHGPALLSSAGEATADDALAGDTDASAPKLTIQKEDHIIGRADGFAADDSRPVQTYPLTTNTSNNLPSQPPPKIEEEPVSAAPTDVYEGRKRRRLGRKRKRRPLHDDYWQSGQGPRDEPETEQNYRDPEPERKRFYSRWERQRPADRWANPYTDAVDPHSTFSSDPPSNRRPFEPHSNRGNRDNFQPIDTNRQRRLPRPEEHQTPGSGYKAYRKPYSQAKRNEEEGGSSDEQGKTGTADLKALLKQSGGLSLSEILQQRNISLQDLIKGKQMALDALTQSPLDITTVTEQDNEATSMLPTLSSVRFRIQDESTPRTDFQEIKSIKRIPVFSPSAASVIVTEEPTTTTATTTTTTTTELPPTAQDEINSVEDIITLDNSGGTQNDNVGIFPTVEIKQLALNPVLPTVKEERLRPIKGVASRIRPDLSNSNIRTEELFSPTKKRLESLRPYATAEPWHSSTSSSTTTTTTTTSSPSPTAREKWTPSVAIQEKYLQKLQQSKTRQRPASTASADPTPEQHAEEILSEVEPSPVRTTSERTLMRIPISRNRPFIKLKVRTSTAAPSHQPESTENHYLADVEFHDESENVTKLLESEEPELNIIEKFTSPEDSKSAPIPQSSSSSEPSTTELSEDELIERINHNTQRSFTDSLEEYFRDVTESNPSLFNDLGPIALSDDRKEILELMEDRRIGARLAKVLSQRNMTLDELLEHRKRGSSQLHLSEMINGKVRPIEDKMDIVTAFEHFPRFSLGNLRSIQPDDIKLDSQGFSYFTSIISMRPTDETHKEGRSMQHRGDHKFMDWKQQPHQQHPTNHKMDGIHFLGNGGSKGGLIVPSRMSADAEFDSSHDQPSSSDLLDLELTGHGFNHRHTVTIESTSMPLGVKSAIIASACIVGISLAVFAVIFVVCRWRQRRRNKLNYTENFNMAKGRLPMMHTESLKNDQMQVYTTQQSQHQQLPQQQQQQQQQHQQYSHHQRQRKDSKVNTMNPNSQEVQDYLWDTMRKPFQ